MAVAAPIIFKVLCMVLIHIQDASFLLAVEFAGSSAVAVLGHFSPLHAFVFSRF